MGWELSPVLPVVEGILVLGYGYDGSNYLFPYDWGKKPPVSSSYDLLGTAQIPRG